jgi:ribosomal-protein-alanine N-acetyltransferase
MIRAGTEADLDAVVEIEHASQPPGWSRAQFQEELQRPGGLFLVAEVEGCVRGFAIGWTVAKQNHILNVAVHPDHRRFGVARNLVESLLASGGGEEALLELRASNTAARALHKALGFEEVGRRPGYYRDGEDAILMTLLGAEVVLPGKG